MIHTIVLLILCLLADAQKDIRFNGAIQQKTDITVSYSQVKSQMWGHIVLIVAGDVTIEVKDKGPQKPQASLLSFFQIESNTLKVIRSSIQNKPAYFTIRKPPRSFTIYNTTNLTYSDNRQLRNQPIKFTGFFSNITLINLFSTTKVDIHANGSSFTLVNCSISKLDVNLSTDSTFKMKNTTTKEMNITVIENQIEDEKNKAVLSMEPGKKKYPTRPKLLLGRRNSVKILSSSSSTKKSKSQQQQGMLYSPNRVPVARFVHMTFNRSNTPHYTSASIKKRLFEFFLTKPIKKIS